MCVFYAWLLIKIYKKVWFKKPGLDKNRPKRGKVKKAHFVYKMLILHIPQPACLYKGDRTQHWAESGSQLAVENIV